jgi:hypothetical protein
MKTRTVFWAAGVLCLLAAVAGAQSKLSGENLALQPPPPAGVNAANWVSISGTLGFVVQKATRDRGVPSVSGYFMIKHEGLWWRVAPEAQAQHLLGRTGGP